VTDPFYHVISPAISLAGPSEPPVETMDWNPFDEDGNLDAYVVNKYAPSYDPKVVKSWLHRSAPALSVASPNGGGAPIAGPTQSLIVQSATTVVQPIASVVVHPPLAQFLKLEKKPTTVRRALLGAIRMLKVEKELVLVETPCIPQLHVMAPTEQFISQFVTCAGGGPSYSNAPNVWKAVSAGPDDFTAFPEFQRLVSRPTVVHAQLFAKLEQKAFGTKRTMLDARNLYGQGVAWCKEHEILDEVVIAALVAPCVTAAMIMTPGEKTLASVLDTHGGQRSVDDANRLASGQFGMSWLQRLFRCMTPNFYSNAISRGAYQLPSA